jgi:hypothetical protein
MLGGGGKTRTSIAFSAFVSWTTPTVAFATRIRRMTRGSTNAPPKVEPSESSKRAKTNEMTAEASNMRTSWSLNCSNMSSQRGVEGSSGSSSKRSAGGRGLEKRVSCYRSFRRPGHALLPGRRRVPCLGARQSALGSGLRFGTKAPPFARKGRRRKM